MEIIQFLTASNRRVPLFYTNEQIWENSNIFVGLLTPLSLINPVSSVMYEAKNHMWFTTIILPQSDIVHVGRQKKIPKEYNTTTIKNCNPSYDQSPACCWKSISTSQIYTLTCTHAASQGRHQRDPFQHGPEGDSHGRLQEARVSRRHGEDGLRRRQARNPLPYRAAQDQR